VSFLPENVPDFAILRANGDPLYTLVNPLDDAMMGITHVLRGEDLLSSTPRQIALYDTLHRYGVGNGPPRFGHLPMVMGEDNRKLSKRDPGSGLLELAMPLVAERINKLSEAPEMLAFLFTDQVEYDEADVAKLLDDAGLDVAAAARDALAAVTTWSTAAIEEALRAKLVDELGLKPRNAFGPVRVAITGRRISPPLFESLELLGRDAALARLDAVLG
jgi:glutamyl/glutaminyl-tRNA synthetase